MTPKEKNEALCIGIQMAEMMSEETMELIPVVHSAKRVATLERFDSLNIHINIFHNGLEKNPWLFEIRYNKVLKCSFPGVPTHYASRVEAEIAAFDVAESMADGTFDIRFSS